MLLLRRRQLQPALPMSAIPLVDGPGLAALLAVLVIVALHSEEARGGEPRLLGARHMHLLFVFALMTAIFFSYLLERFFRPLIRAVCLVFSV
jgi:hypothetical protein